MITLESNTVPVQYAKFVMEDVRTVPYRVQMVLIQYRVTLKLSSECILLNSHFLASFFLACTPTLSVKTAVKKKNIWNVLTVKKLFNASSIKSHHFIMVSKKCMTPWMFLGNGLSCIRISNNNFISSDELRSCFRLRTPIQIVTFSKMNRISRSQK